MRLNSLHLVYWSIGRLSPYSVGHKDCGLCCRSEIVSIELFQATAILLEMSSTIGSMGRKIKFYRRLVDSFLKNATFSRDIIRNIRKIRKQFLSVLQSWQLWGINAPILRMCRWSKQAEVWWSFHHRHLSDGWSAFIWVLPLNHLFNDGHFEPWMGTVSMLYAVCLLASLNNGMSLLIMYSLLECCFSDCDRADAEREALIPRTNDAQGLDIKHVCD